MPNNPKADSGPGAGSVSAALPTDAQPPTSAQKSAATVLRNKEQRRAETLSDIQAQTANGTLVIRQMTSEQRESATEAARQTRQRNEARSRQYRN